MQRNVNLEIFYPHPPQKVWQALTNRRALAAWLMDNDFEPRVGHKFRFQPLSSLDETIYCEVIKLDQPKCLSYTWRGNFMSTPTIVTWTLEPVDGGTRLKLEHREIESRVTQPIRLQKSSQDNSIFKATLEPIEQKTSFPMGYAATKSIDNVTLKFYLNGGWHTALNNRLQNLLTSISE